MTRAIITLMAAALAAATAGCLGGIGDACSIDSECRTSLFCFVPSEVVAAGGNEGTCRRPCHDDGDCGGLSVCIEGGACFQPSQVPDGDEDGMDAPIDETPVDVRDVDAVDTPPDDGADELEIPDDCPARPDPGDPCSPPSSFGRVFRMTSFLVGEDGHPGSGLDLDGNPATCSPGQAAEPPVCSGGIDNGLAQLGIMGNPSLRAAILPPPDGNGTMNSLLELTLFNEEGCPLMIDFYNGVRVSGEPGCMSEEGCVYAVASASFDPGSCLPVSSIGGVLFSSGTLAGGRDEDVYYFDAIVVGMHVVVPIYRPRVEAAVTTSGGEPAAVEGIIGGIVAKQDFMDAFAAIPEEDYPNPPTKDDVIAMWETIYADGPFELDVDLDGDTVKESSTIGLLFSALPVDVSGLAP